MIMSRTGRCERPPRTAPLSRLTDSSSETKIGNLGCRMRNYQAMAAKTDTKVAAMPYVVVLNGQVIAGFREHWAAKRFVKNRPGAVIRRGTPS